MRECVQESVCARAREREEGATRGVAKCGDAGIACPKPSFCISTSGLPRSMAKRGRQRRGAQQRAPLAHGTSCTLDRLRRATSMPPTPPPLLPFPSPYPPHTPDHAPAHCRCDCQVRVRCRPRQDLARHHQHLRPRQRHQRRSPDGEVGWAGASERHPSTAAALLAPGCKPILLLLLLHVWPGHVHASRRVSTVR